MWMWEKARVILIRQLWKRNFKIPKNMPDLIMA